MIPGIVSQQAFLNGGATVDAAAFSPGYKHDRAILTNDNRTAQISDQGYAIVGVMDAKITGKWYFEVTVEEFGSSNDEIIVGVGDYYAPLNTYIGVNTRSTGWAWNNRIIYNNGNIASPGSFTEGDVIGVEVDADTRILKFRKNGGSWTAVSQLSSGTQPLMPLVQLYRAGARVTINTGQEPWHTNPESGYQPWTRNIPTAARYWRYLTNNASITPGLAHMIEFEMRETFGGPNVVSGGTASADQSHDASSLPANAFDGNNTTFWSTTFNSPAPHWLQYDFGAGNEKLLSEVVLQPRADTNQGQSPDHRILYSYDGTVFFPAHGRAGVAMAQGSRNVFALFGETPPAISVKTSDTYYYNSGFQLDATNKANGASYTADDSKYAHAITLNGGMAIAGQRLVFDGTDDYVYHNNANSALFTPGHMTSWEMFGVEFATLSGQLMLMANYRADNGGHGWRIYYEAGQLHVGVATTDSASLTVPLSYTWAPLTDGTAYDILLTWDRTTFRLYIDGEFVASAAYSNNIAQTTNVGVSVGCDFGIGNTARSFFNGKMRGVRLTCGVDRSAGSVTTYERHGLPLTKTQAALDDALWGNVVFLLHGEGADASTTFRDLSPYDRRMTAAGAVQNDTDISVGDSPSVKFDADGNYLVGAYGPELDLGATSPDFCMEAYVYGTQFASVINQLFARRRNSNNWAIWVDGNNVNFLTFNGTSGTSRLNIAHDMTTNTPHHFCLIRSGTTFYLFIDGVLKGSNTSSSGTFGTSTTDLYIGESENDQATRYWRGNLNWMRITMGASRYNLAGFTPPTVPLAIS